jgi:hypothetical protein
MHVCENRIFHHPDQAWQSRRAIIFRFGGFVLRRTTIMPPRLQKYLWRMRDRTTPEGGPPFSWRPPLLLLIVNGFILLL